MVIGIGGIILANNSSPRFHRALAAATTHQPERYTELYFNDQTRLPIKAAVNRTQMFSFELANHENSTKTYTYTAIISTNNDKWPNDVGSSYVRIATA